MLSVTLSLLLHGLYLMLRMGPPGSGSFPKPLSAEEEGEQLKRMAAGDINARNTLIEHNLRLVAHVIKKYYVSQSDQDDLISIGTIGLIKAITTFTEGKGTRLATYAARCIENEILMHFRKQKRTQSELSLSEPIDVDREGNALALMDILSVDDYTLERIGDEETETLLKKLLGSCLNEREREIVTLRYGLSGKAPLTQREIAGSMGISRSYVSRIEKKALEQLEEGFAQNEK